MSGFIARNFIWIGTGSGSTNHAVTICKGCAKALIRCGWRLDARHSDIDDIKYYSGGSGTYACWYVLNSKTKGAKLLVYYNYYNRTNLSAQACGYEGRISGSGNFICGLGLSIIPHGSSSDFGSNPTSEDPLFIPSDATYLCGEIFTGSYRSSDAYSNTNGRQYEYIFISDGEETVFFYQIRANSLYASFCVGKIVGTLSYPEIDNSHFSKYGALQLCSTNSGNAASFLSLDTIPDSTSNIMLAGSESSFVFLPNGTRYSFPSNTGGKSCRPIADYSLSNSRLCSSYKNGQRRWSPLGIGIFNVDPSSGQVINGADGFKGYLDTDLFRFVGTNNIVREQLLDSGSFIYISNGLAIAWDATNIIKPTYNNSAIDTRNYDGSADPFA